MIEFSLKQLEIFIAIVEFGSFTRAAEELFLNQSTVSSHLMALEQILGKPLFIRNCRRQVCMTPAGETLYPIAKEIIGTCKSIPSLFRNAEPYRPILLGASTVPGQYLLPQYLSAFLGEQKKFRYVLRHGDSTRIHKLLKNGEIRLGFVGTISEPETVDYFPLSEDRLVLVAPNLPHYQMLKERGAFGRDLLTEPMVARSEGSGTGRTAHNYIKSLGLSSKNLSVVARMDDPEAIKHMVIGGFGVAILSSLSVRQEVAAGTVLSFEMDPKGLTRGIYLATMRNAAFTPAEQELLTFLKTYRPQSNG